MAELDDNHSHALQPTYLVDNLDQNMEGTLFQRRKLISVAAILAIIVSCLICANAHSATQDSDVVRINSWKKGNTKISEKVFTLMLASDTAEYEFDFYSIAIPEKHFKARFRKQNLKTVRNTSLKCWVASLREVSADVAGVNLLGSNLLSVEGPGPVDNFPREEWGGVFCPIEEPNRVLDGPIYPMRTKRNFYIEGFVLQLQVIDYQPDKHRNQLGNMELKVSLSNR